MFDENEDVPKWLIGMFDLTTDVPEEHKQFAQDCCLSSNEIKAIQAAVGTMLSVYQHPDTEDLEPGTTEFQIGLLLGIIEKIKMATGIGEDDDDESTFMPWEMN